MSSAEKNKDSLSQEAEQMQASNVRRSIGEWEAAIPNQGSSNPSPRAAQVAPAAPCKAKTQSLTQGPTGEVTDRRSVETTTSPKPKYKNRTSEARACLTSAKLQLGKARNLRTDIKNEVTQNIERLYQLVKDSESNKEKGKGIECTREDNEAEIDKVEENKLTPTTNELNADLIRAMEVHADKLRVASDRMEELKTQLEAAMKPSYAEALAAGMSRISRQEGTTQSNPTKGPSHSLIISSEEGNDTSDQILTKIRKAIQPRENGLQTFSTVRGGKTYASHVDVTACTADLYGVAEDWRVVEDLTSSDHNGIVFQLKMEKAMGFNVKRTTRLYNTKKANWEGFHEQLDLLLLDHRITEPEINKIASIDELDSLVVKFTEIIGQACLETMPKKKVNEKLALPWWSEELAKLKKDMMTKKRRVRCAAAVRKPDRYR
ncbi:unnamed protein product [Plutella xylostella]|uniref:(diamondback moth) hypothetical protein n=1 Tax=Plutella xylostella TaxID=51655 RepID=A0A8S4DML5_PLUXY|nr:unnamed protein product [Plutella xylostella]